MSSAYVLQEITEETEGFSLFSLFAPVDVLFRLLMNTALDGGIGWFGYKA
jgi:hypothetical protein